jgi:tetrahydrodipicolinate N-succinyltransferase
VTVGARIGVPVGDGGIVEVGIVVSLGRGLFSEAGPVQLLSSAKMTTMYKSDRVGLPFAKLFRGNLLGVNKFSQSVGRSRKRLRPMSV